MPLNCDFSFLLSLFFVHGRHKSKNIPFAVMEEVLGSLVQEIVVSTFILQIFMI